MTKITLKIQKPENTMRGAFLTGMRAIRNSYAVAHIPVDPQFSIIEIRNKNMAEAMASYKQFRTAFHHKIYKMEVCTGKNTKVIYDRSI
jgi:hypothetical protein